jgi:hypothetical protein
LALHVADFSSTTTFTVPPGCTSITIDVYGAGGGGGGKSKGDKNKSPMARAAGDKGKESKVVSLHKRYTDSYLDYGDAVKGLTGENPSFFFKTYKLNRAAELLVEGKYTVSEIADLTGFSTLSHFSKSFKKQFGITPSEYNKT